MTSQIVSRRREGGGGWLLVLFHLFNGMSSELVSSAVTKTTIKVCRCSLWSSFIHSSMAVGRLEKLSSFSQLFAQDVSSSCQASDSSFEIYFSSPAAQRTTAINFLCGHRKDIYFLYCMVIIIINN